MAKKITVFWCKTDPDILLYMEFKYTRPIQKDFQRDDNITKTTIWATVVGLLNLVHAYR